MASERLCLKDFLKINTGSHVWASAEHVRRSYLKRSARLEPTAVCFSGLLGLLIVQFVSLIPLPPHVCDLRSSALQPEKLPVFSHVHSISMLTAQITDSRSVVSQMKHWRRRSITFLVILVVYTPRISF